MYKTKVAIDKSVFTKLRVASTLAPETVSVFVKSLQADVLKQVEKKVAPYPRPSVHPFEFATRRSMRWYFAALSRGEIPTDGKRYKRQHNLDKAWRVKSDRRGLATFMTIENRAAYAVFVYGSGVLVTRSRQVPGHRRTGWGGKKLDRAVAEISLGVQSRVQDWWFLTGLELPL